MPNYDAERLEQAVAEFLEHLHYDLPPGPPSELGGDIPRHQVTLTEREFRRRAELGKRMVDAHIAAKEASRQT